MTGSIKEQAMLKALLHHFHKDETLLRFLPSTAEGPIQQAPEMEAVDFRSLLSPRAWIFSIHFSWFEPILKTFPPSFLPLLLSLFSPKQAKALSPTLPQKPPLFTQLFLAHSLKQRMIPASILPQELLPAAPLNTLLHLSGQQLLYVFDYLGLFDLAADFRQIVDKQLIQKIHAALREDQLLFLRYCSKLPSKWIPPKLGLSGWNGDKATLQTLLQQRGLIRLAKALMDEHPSLIWHLIHSIDSNRGKVIADHVRSPTEKNVALIPFFKAQVLDILTRLTP